MKKKSNVTWESRDVVIKNAHAFADGSVAKMESWAYNKVTRNPIDFAVNELARHSVIAQPSFDGMKINCVVSEYIKRYHGTMKDENFDWDLTTFTDNDNGENGQLVTRELFDVTIGRRLYTFTKFILPVYHYFNKIDHFLKVLYEKYDWKCIDVFAELMHACLPNNTTFYMNVEIDHILISVYYIPTESEAAGADNYNRKILQAKIKAPCSPDKLLLPSNILNCVQTLPLYAGMYMHNDLWWERVYPSDDELSDCAIFYNREKDRLELYSEDTIRDLEFVIPKSLMSTNVQDIPIGMRNLKGGSYDENYHCIEFQNEFLR